MIYCLCPFSKPEFKDLVLHNYNQQTHPNKHLLVVENGPGLGCFYPAPGITVLSSGNHQSLAKNVGLAYLRSIGAEYWAGWDCDDYYGPQYLEELEQNKSKATVIGKTMYYLRTDDGSLFLFNEERPPGHIMGVWGATIGCWVNKSPDFPVVPTGEEEIWIRNFRLVSGIYNTGPKNFVHLRWKSGHTTHGMTRHQFLYAHQNGRRISRFHIPEDLAPFLHPIYQIA